MAKHIFISESEIQRLRAVVDQHLEGRDGATGLNRRDGPALTRA